MRQARHLLSSPAMALIKPVLQGQALVADVKASAGRQGPRGLPGIRGWWLGQSGFLLQYDGRHALIDPYLSDSLTDKYAATDKPHVRMTELAVRPEELAAVGIDVVSSSHNHTDHLDAATLMPLMAALPGIKIIVPEANRAFAAERLKVAPEELLGVNVDGEPATVGPFTFHAVPAAHDELAVDERGRHKFVGYVILCGEYGVYHSGDTQLYEGLVTRLRRLGPIDVAILPINGRGPERRVAGNLWGREAAKLAHDIRARLAIPCHYDMFTFNTATPDEFIAACAELHQPCRVLQCGERFEVI